MDLFNHHIYWRYLWCCQYYLNSFCFNSITQAKDVLMVMELKWTQETDLEVVVVKSSDSPRINNSPLLLLLLPWPVMVPALLNIIVTILIQATMIMMMGITIQYPAIHCHCLCQQPPPRLLPPTIHQLQVSFVMHIGIILGHRKILIGSKKH